MKRVVADKGSGKRLYAVVVRDAATLSRLAQTRRAREGFVAAVVFLEADRGDVISLKKRFREIEVLLLEQAALSLTLIATRA